MLIQPLMSNGTIESLNVGILLWLNILQLDSVFLCPGNQVTAQVFRLIIASNDFRFAALFNIMRFRVMHEIH